MTRTDFTPLYKNEDDLTSIRIGRPGAGDGAFISFDGNIQIGITDSEYTATLFPLLKAIVEERTDGVFKFYKGYAGGYCLQNMGLLLFMSRQTGEALQKHAKLILNEEI